MRIHRTNYIQQLNLKFRSLSIFFAKHVSKAPSRPHGLRSGLDHAKVAGYSPPYQWPRGLYPHRINSVVKIPASSLVSWLTSPALAQNPRSEMCETVLYLSACRGVYCPSNESHPVLGIDHVVGVLITSVLRRGAGQPIS
jgi:hypothetical protein